MGFYLKGLTSNRWPSSEKYNPVGCFVLVSYCWDKDHDQNQLGDERVCLTYLSKPSLKGTKTRAVEEYSLLVRSQDLLRVLSYTTQDHLLA